MLGAAWLCVLALALPCWAYPSEHTTCEEFGRGISLDPVNTVGEWFNVYCFDGGVQSNVAEKMTIRELTSSQLQQYEQVFKGYSKDQLKLEFKIHNLHPLVLDVDSVLVPQENTGNVDAWITHIQIDGTEMPMHNYTPYSLKWKSVNGFLVVMLCNNQKVFVFSKTATPDKDRLQRAVDSLDVKSITGNSGGIYSSLLTLL